MNPPRRTLALALLILALATAASFAGRASWLLEALSHFRPFLALAALLALLYVLALRRWRLVPAALAVAFVNAAPLSPYVVPRAQSAAAGTGAELRLLHLNLRFWHADLAAVEALIARENPDVILLTELAADTAPRLARLGEAYPFRHLDRAGNLLSVLTLSRVPIERATVHTPVAPELPITEARLCPDFAPACLTLIALHAPRPMPAAATALRDRQLAFVARRAAEAGARVVVAGDLNVTPWSPAFADLVEGGRLTDAALGRGIVSTWYGIPGLVGLPIDHVLVGAAVEALDRRVGPDVGSDHRPVIADLRLR